MTKVPTAGIGRCDKLTATFAAERLPPNAQEGEIAASNKYSVDQNRRAKRRVLLVIMFFIETYRLADAFGELNKTKSMANIVMRSGLISSGQRWRVGVVRGPEQIAACVASFTFGASRRPPVETSASAQSSPKWRMSPSARCRFDSR